MNRVHSISVTVAVAIVMWLAPSETLAIDPPHDTLPCGQCHTSHGAAYPANLGRLCEECHFNGGPAREANTHSSRLIDSGYGNWEVDCWGCHDPHTQEQEPAATDGVFLRRDLNAQIKEIDPADPGPYWPSIATLRTVTSSNVTFDAASTPDSDFVDGDASFDDDICQVCHQSTSNYNGLTALNSHSDYGADSQPGGDCATCHTHASGFGVSGGGCTSCHASLQPDDSPPPAGEYRRQVTGVDGDFERKSHHVTDGTQTEIITDGDCEICHAQDNHQNNIDPQVRLYDADDHATIYTWDGSGSSLEAFCLSCHDANGSVADGAQPFGDGRSPTDIETGWNAAQPSPHKGNPQGCLACHGGDDSTDSLLPVLPGYEHNVHGACNDFMLSGRVDGVDVSPTVSIVRVDAPVGRGDVYEINVNGSTVASYVAARNDTQVMVRDDLLNDIISLSSTTVSAEAVGPIGLAVIPGDACTPFAVDLGATDGNMVLDADISAASYVCMGCHDADGPATADIASQFQIGGYWLSQTGSTLSRTHDLLLSMDCSDCHNPHSSNGLGFADTDPQRTLRPDPDPADGWAPGDSNGDGTPDSNAGGNLWSEGVTPSSWISEWCLSCHDGNMPASIRQPAALVNIYDVWIGPNAISQHGALNSGADLTVASGYPDGGTNTILNCETCHHKGHNIDSKLAQTLANPLDATGSPIVDSEQYGLPVEPYDDPTVDGPLWCTACHQSDMGNPECEGCHNHGDGRF